MMTNEGPTCSALIPQVDVEHIRSRLLEKCPHDQEKFAWNEIDLLGTRS